METKKRGQPIGRKLQLVLLLPVLIGVIICTIIVVTILFVSQREWLQDTKAYIIEEEEEFMLTYSKSVANTIESTLGTQWYYLNFLTQVYEKVGNDEIKTSDNIQDPDYINAYDVKGTEYPDTTRSEWLSGENSEIKDYIEQLRLPDALMRTVYLSSNISKQIGFILNTNNDDLMYVYPVEDMQFIEEKYDYKDSCGTTDAKFTPTCTDQFTILKDNDMLLMTYYDAGHLFILNKFKDGAGVSLLPEDYLINYLVDSEEYTTFICHKEGNWTVYVSGSDLEDFTGENKEISKALYKGNDDSRRDFLDKVGSEFKINDQGNIKTSIDGSTVYFAYTRANITINGSTENSYVVGLTRTESSMLESWNGFIDELLKISIIQACIFGVFLIISFIVAWRLSLVVVYRVVHPLDAITGYLNKNDPPLCSIQNTFNSQINSILDNLRKIEVIEKFIDPAFLMHPLFKTRFANLTEARQLFTDIDNKRGVSIVNNLMGNMLFNKKKYEEAEIFYRESLKSLQGLLQDIKNQEQEENSLNEKERQKLNSRKDNFKDAWSDERSIVEEAISEKQQQICMALMARLKESHNESTLVLMRTKWKELIKMQTEILQYYENTRKSFVKYLKLLIDLSESYQVLQYFHTASELLEIVNEELWKIDTDKKVEIDIDGNRLRKIGIYIVETDKLVHFKVDKLSFEKDILMQKMLFRRAMIALDNDKFHRAAKDLTMALECGKYYDPVVRKDSIEALYNLFKKFGLIGLTADLESLYAESCKPRKNIMVCLSYDLKSNSSLNAQIVNMFNSVIENGKFRLGAITKNNRIKTMPVCIRDFPGYDLENLVIQSKNCEDSENLIDTMHRGIEILNEFSGGQVSENILLVFYRKESEVPSVGNEETLSMKMDNTIRTIFVNFGEAYSINFEILLENNRGEKLECKNKDLKNIQHLIWSLIGYRV